MPNNPEYMVLLGITRYWIIGMPSTSKLGGFSNPFGKTVPLKMPLLTNGFFLI